MRMIIVTLMLQGSWSMAQIKPYAGTTKVGNPDYREYYVVNGSKATEAEAFMSLLQGKQIDRCIGQEASMGKSGKSASMKNMPKNR